MAGRWPRCTRVCALFHRNLARLDALGLRQRERQDALVHIRGDLARVDGGVQLARKGQEDAGTGFTNLEGALKDCVEMGVSVYADELSLKALHLEPGDLVEGIKIIKGGEIAGLAKEAKATMIF